MVRPPKDKQLLVRVSEEERSEWHSAAEREDMSLSDWVRRACRTALAKLKKK